MSKIKDKSLWKILVEIDSLLNRFLEGKHQLFLFGSTARGNGGMDSDVDLMVVLEDEVSKLPTKEKIREIIYGFSVKTPYLFSVLIVSRSLAEKRKGFLVFDSVEREGILIGA